MILLQDKNSNGVNYKTWYCELSDETGTESDIELESKIQAELLKLPASVPTGSLVEILTNKKRLIVKIKNSQGEWKDI